MLGILTDKENFDSGVCSGLGFIDSNQNEINIWFFLLWRCGKSKTLLLKTIQMLFS